MGSQGVHIYFFCCADIYWTSIVHGQSGHVCLSHIADKDIVSSLFAIPVDGDALSCQKLLGKNCDYASFSVRILAWPIHIRIPKRHVGETIRDSIEVQIQLPGSLADPVGANRLCEMILGSRKRLLFTIYCSTRRRENHTLTRCQSRTLKNVQQTNNIHPCIKQRISHGAADIQLGSVMIDHFNAFAHNQLTDCRISNIGLNEMSVRRDVGCPSR